MQIKLFAFEKKKFSFKMTQNSFDSIGVFLSIREMQILRQSKLTGIYRNN